MDDGHPAVGAAVSEHARAVVVGGGVAGAGIAYHLASLGWRDVVLLERRSLTCGTTWHAAGLIGRLRASRAACRLVQASAELYARLPAETGQATGWRHCGSLIVTRTPERLVQLRRSVALGRAAGIEAHIVGPRDIARLWPLCRTDDLAGAMVVPDDGRVIPADVTQALAAGARARGVTIREGVAVTGVRTRDGVVTAVATAAGDIACEVVVNCAGMWARALGQASGVPVPLCRLPTATRSAGGWAWATCNACRARRPRRCWTDGTRSTWPVAVCP
jgi:4-methylaminobutanoate oxidase (formaldehyde-forming)